MRFLCGSTALWLLWSVSALPAGAEEPAPRLERVAVDVAAPAGSATTEAGAVAPDPLFDEDFDEAIEAEAYDPFERGNRAVYRFNRRLDRWVWDPFTRGYRFVVPDPARRAVRRVLINLNMPIYVMNNLLQLRFVDAADTFGAFLMNSTFGIGGLFDTAQGANFALHPADFGQTLALFGVGNGPYLVFPFFGPSTLRDGFGGVVDRAFHPLTYVLPIPTQLMWGGGMGVTRREEAHDQLKALEESSLDPYAVLRSAYLQVRQQSIDELRQDEDSVTAGGDDAAGALAGAF